MEAQFFIKLLTKRRLFLFNEVKYTKFYVYAKFYIFSGFFEEVGVDEGEGDGAEAFDLDDDVLVAADAAGVAFVAGKRSADHAKSVADLEFFFAVDLTPHGVVGCQQPEKTHLFFAYGLQLATAQVAVDPELRQTGGLGAALGLDALGLIFLGIHEEQARDHGPLMHFAVGAPHIFYGQVGLDMPLAELSLKLEGLGCTYGVPVFHRGE